MFDTSFYARVARRSAPVLRRRHHTMFPFDARRALMDAIPAAYAMLQDARALCQVRVEQLARALHARTPCSLR